MAILRRNPTSNELKKHVTSIDKNEYSLAELEIRLYNTDEYKRMIKTQNNSLSPEMSRMVEEKEVLFYIRELYFRARAQKADKSILLPLKDLFIYFDFNPYKLLALFRHSNYKDFEDDFKNSKNLTKQALIEMYLARFDDIKLSQDAEALKKSEKLAALSKSSQPVSGVSASADGAAIGLKDTDTDKLLQYLLSKGLYITDKDKIKLVKNLLVRKNKEDLLPKLKLVQIAIALENVSI